MFPIKPYSFRTNTLPRLKQKFLKQQNTIMNNKIEPTTIPITSFENTNDNNNNNKLINDNEKQKLRLEKCYNEVLKSLKYLEQVINKNKFEIIATSTTFVLETILDIYNLLMSKDNYNNVNDEDDYDYNDNKNNTNKCNNEELRYRINRLLANIIKISDKLLCKENSNIESNKQNLIDLIKELTDSILNLIENENIKFNKTKVAKLKKQQIFSSDSKLNESELNETKAAIKRESKLLSSSNSWSEHLNNIEVEDEDDDDDGDGEIYKPIDEDDDEYIIKKLTKTITTVSPNKTVTSTAEFKLATNAADKSDNNNNTSLEKNLNLNIDNLALEISNLPTLNFTDEQFRYIFEKCNQLFTDNNQNSEKLIEQNFKLKHNIEEKTTVINSISNDYNKNEKILDKKSDYKKFSLTETKSFHEEDELKQQQKKQHINEYMSLFMNNQNSCPNLFMTTNVESQFSSSSSSLSALPHNDNKLNELVASVDVASINIDDLINKSKLSYNDKNTSNFDNSSSVKSANFENKSTDDSTVNNNVNINNNNTQNRFSYSSDSTTSSLLSSSNTSTSSQSQNIKSNKASFLTPESSNLSNYLDESYNLFNTSSSSKTTTDVSTMRTSDNSSINSIKNTKLNTVNEFNFTNENDYYECIESFSSNNELNLLNINDFLEYQNSEQLAASVTYHLQTSTQLTPTIPTALRGGSIDALLVLATSAEKKDFLYQEAFLTTYRTMIEPKELIYKLLYRYHLFDSKSYDSLKNKASKNSFALLVRVLDELGNELTDEIIEIFQNFVSHLLLNDQLQLARILRKKLINKIEKKNSTAFNFYTVNPFKNSTNSVIDNNKQQLILLPVNNISQKRYSLLDFKSSDLAEQMTLIDIDLFLKIELSEVLLWSTKQCEELSPNLTKFTEHFNNISYWTRSRLLEQENSRDREKYMEKFLKIMKHLRKINNFNSYLAILSAVDSGPVQRLDWPKHTIELIKDFSSLIDPKCGFKRLRETVTEAQPPCIPHIGLILQDLTILHIANPDFLPSGNCNFWKRWQQFNILEKLRCFRNCQYNFKRNMKIINFFNNFTDFICEDAQYALSEQIKPRTKS